MKIKFSVKKLLLFLLSLPTIVFLIVSASYEFLMFLFLFLFLPKMDSGNIQSIFFGIPAFVFLIVITLCQLISIRKIFFREKIFWAFVVIPFVLISSIAFIWINIFMPADLNFDFASTCVQLNNRSFNFEQIQTLHGYCELPTEHRGFNSLDTCTSQDVDSVKKENQKLIVWSMKDDTAQIFCAISPTGNKINTKLGTYFD